tara:strand:+ start:5730 stop:6188 length:459 start_codon:yes stop_codon:yes gene_type:complete
MILGPDIQQFNIDYMYLFNPVKNNVIEDSRFIRIIYSNNHFVLNASYIFFNFFDTVTFEAYYNKYKCSFDVTRNSDIINQLKIIEEQILHKLNYSHKMPKFLINDQLTVGTIKLFEPRKDKNSFILKISGIWETDTHYGLTYKFLTAGEEYK